MKREFAKPTKAEQERVELEYHQTNPEEFDELMGEETAFLLRSPANRKRLLEAIAEVESERNIVVPDQEEFNENGFCRARLSPLLTKPWFGVTKLAPWVSE